MTWLDIAYSQNWVEQLRDGYEQTVARYDDCGLQHIIRRNKEHFVDLSVTWMHTPQGGDIWSRRNYEVSNMSLVHYSLIR